MMNEGRETALEWGFQTWESMSLGGKKSHHVFINGKKSRFLLIEIYHMLQF